MGTVLRDTISFGNWIIRTVPVILRDSPYSSGIITFEIPFDKIRPFLTDEAKTLLP